MSFTVAIRPIGRRFGVLGGEAAQESPARSAGDDGRAYAGAAMA
jgi:hypothetical protein